MLLNYVEQDYNYILKKKNQKTTQTIHVKEHYSGCKSKHSEVSKCQK